MGTQKRSFASLIFASLFFISGCEEPPQTVVADSRPVKTIVIGGHSPEDSRRFPAIVDAIQKAEMSFRVSGKIQAIHVKEGNKVKKGQILAELDPTDFEITLKDRQASFNTSKANFDRAKKLVAKGAISKVDHDNIRARYHTAQASLEEAKQHLRYTTLKANFDGFIAKRHVENFEEVKQSESVFSLEDVSALKIQIDVPENLMIAIDKTRNKKRQLYAVFDNIKNTRFPLEFSEASTKADLNTKTFKVTLKMDAPDSHNILPGMTATVIAEILSNETNLSTYISVPVSAVISNNEKQAIIWIVDEKSMTVTSKKVTPGLMTGKTMRVEGLNAGERVVIAGAAFLRNNMKVTLLETGEQPE